MSVAGSQISRFQQPLNQKRTFTQLNGQLVPTSFDIKSLNYSGEIKIENPQIMNTIASGDKQVTIKYLQFYDQRVLTNIESVNLAQIFRIVVQNQRNNFDELGNQTTVVGFLTYDISKKVYQADSQPFEMDSRSKVIIKLQSQITTIVSGLPIRTWTDFIIDNSQHPNSYIYSDININFEDID